MQEAYLTFRSLTRAQLAAAVLAQARIDARFLRAPEAAAKQGCGYALLVRRSALAAAAQTLRQGGAGFERAYLDGGDGQLRELRL